MTRPLRLEHAGAVWHVTSRGNERKELFRGQADCERFISILARTVTLFQWRLHAYVLMGNHYHLLLETPAPTLSRGMRQLNGIYTQAFNRRHRRAGHLLQGRFKAILVEKEAHLLELCRYVVLNPVRAGLVRSARDWKWSSYRATSAEEPAPEWLETRWTLRNFGRETSQAVRRYRKFVAEGVGAAESPWQAVRAQVYLGGDEFLEEVRQRLKARPMAKGIPRRQVEPLEVDPLVAATAVAKVLGSGLEEMKRRPRVLIRERRLTAWALKSFGMVPLDGIGKALGVGVAQASALAAAGDTETLTASLRDRIEKAVRE
ncbi:MAG: transposase [Acidobacteria bacterium]|nr:transposase [Acidobacteriota bacterium]